MTDTLHILIDLAVALSLGLLVGTERGWRQRAVEEGGRVFGLRSFTLFGLLGGMAAVLHAPFGAAGMLLPGLFALGVIMMGAWIEFSHRQDAGMTTELAAAATFCLGALAAAGYPMQAAAVTVMLVLLLGGKQHMHSTLGKLKWVELKAGLQLLLVSVVVLPWLPNHGYGPWEALNPYHVWWMVVLISGLSFAGFLAIRWFGVSRGLIATGFFGGLASSTAVTLHFSRLGRTHGNRQALFAAAILLAAATMYPRVAVEVLVVHPALLAEVAVWLTAFTVAGVFWAYIAWHRLPGSHADQHAEAPDISFTLASAMQFALLLAVIMVAAEAARAYLGDGGLYLLAAVSGLTDVDALTLTVAKMAGQGLSASVAGNAILIAVAVNTLVKAAMAWVLCGGYLARVVSYQVVTVVLVGVFVVALGL